MPDQNESLTNEYRRFNSWRDYEYFLRLVRNSPEFAEVPARKPYSNVGGFVQFWYRHRPTGRVCRLVQPDGPFRGAWELVPNDELA